MVIKKYLTARERERGASMCVVIVCRYRICYMAIRIVLGQRRPWLNQGQGRVLTSFFGSHLHDDNIQHYVVPGSRRPSIKQVGDLFFSWPAFLLRKGSCGHQPQSATEHLAGLQTNTWLTSFCLSFRIHSQSVQWSHLQRHDPGDRCLLLQGTMAALQK